MHILGILFIVLILGAVLSPLDAVGAWWFDRKRQS